MVGRHPFLYQLLRLFRQVALGHLHCFEVEDADMFTIKGVDMARFMFFRLEEHLYDDSVKPAYFWQWYHLCFSIPQYFLHYKQNPGSIIWTARRFEITEKVIFHGDVAQYIVGISSFQYDKK